MATRDRLPGSMIRQDGYRSQTGMSNVDPQDLFPPSALNGGPRIPANVMSAARAGFDLPALYVTPVSQVRGAPDEAAAVSS